MRIDFFTSLYERLEAKYIASQIVNIVQAIAIIYMAYSMAKIANNKTVTVVPSHLAAKVEVGPEYANPEYIDVMVTHITHLLYTYTHDRAAPQFSEFLAYIPVSDESKNREALVSKLQQRTDQIGKLRISEAFLKKGPITMLRGDACAIAGTIRRWSSSTEIAHEDLFIRYKYKIIGGGFTIDEMQILTGAEYAAVLRDERLR